MKIVGLDKYLLTPRGVPFKNGEDDVLLGDMIYELSSRVFQGQSDEQKMLGYKIAKKLAFPSTEMDMTAEEIALIKTLALKTSPPLFCGAISDALESGGIGATNVAKLHQPNGAEAKDAEEAKQ